MNQTASTKMPVTFAGDASTPTQADFDGTKLRVAGRDVTRADWQTAVRAHAGKRQINILLDGPSEG